LDAIVKVFMQIQLLPELLSQSSFMPPRSPEEIEWIAFYYFSGCDFVKAKDSNPALAMCKLLIAINPAPIAPLQVAIIDDDGEVETVFEAEFV
jgi:hypothetical protein